MNPFKKSFVLILLLCQVVMAGTVVAVEPTADNARSALQKRSFPWYDSTKDAYRPLRPVKKDASTSSANTASKNSRVGENIANAAVPISQIVMWSLLAALIVGLLIVIIRGAQNIDINLDSATKTATATVNLEALEALPEPTRGVSDLLGEAARLASQSSYGSAMTFYYSWQLLQLDQHQVIEVQKGKTNRQYSREVGAAMPELLKVVSPSIRLFEDAFFGGLPITGDDFQRVWEERFRFMFTKRSTRS